MLTATFLILSALSGTYAALGPSGTLNVANKVISPDGFVRPAVLAGGTFPGPLIKGKKGDRFQINVVDNLTDKSMVKSTSIHWHGLFQKGTNYADGPAFVSQCPIVPGNSFVYDFTVPDQAGTYWYHSHLSTQYCDGLRGPLVVYDLADPAKSLYDVDDESTILTLSDWYHYLSPQSPKQSPNMFNSTLINGLGRYQGGPLTPLAVISVVPQRRYRFRLISMSCDPNWIFSIDGHSMTIIEVDGVNHKPLTVDSIQIFAGQRYSFVLTANKKIDNYWIRAQPTLAGTNQGFVNATNSAILRYVGAPARDPTTISSIRQPLVETALHPLVSTPVPGLHVPGGADKNIRLEIGIDFTTFTWQLNGSTFTSPNVPVLLQILSGAHTAQELLPAGSVIPLPSNKVIEVSIPGGSPGAPHPFHLHGHNFHVIRSAGNSTYNFDNPVIRDVISTGELTTDLSTFRFVTDNAGPWFLHCHIDWHLDAGLAIVFAEDVPTISHEDPPPAWDQLCPLYDASAKD
ncbi:laccase 2 precursor [Mycena rebaudengoi]|nr:laccase 2 precursor [Mycena rebaudengoi]KAJ7241468.1 laccase 2 precursor [Mycena rebaudengoi]